MTEVTPPSADRPPAASGDSAKDPFVRESAVHPLGTQGMKILLLSLSVLFAASLAGYLVVRLRAPEWPPPGMPPLPRGLWLSTGLILVSGVTMHWALIAARLNRRTALGTALALTTTLGVAFLISQIVNWSGVRLTQAPSPGQIDGAKMFAFTFYLLTFLHAAHVLGGLGPLAVTTAHAFSGRYSAAHHPGVWYSTMYWHFLTVVWVVIFIVLYVAS
jgi:cytochrome c oxidase subunit III